MKYNNNYGHGYDHDRSPRRRQFNYCKHNSRNSLNSNKPSQNKKKQERGKIIYNFYRCGMKGH